MCSPTMELLKAESMAEKREALATGRLERGWFRGRPSTEKDRSAARNRSAFTALRVRPTAAAATATEHACDREETLQLGDASAKSSIFFPRAMVVETPVYKGSRTNGLGGVFFSSGADNEVVAAQQS